jgi:hypothetical protein
MAKHPSHVLLALLAAQAMTSADLVYETGLPLVIVEGLIAGTIPFTLKTSALIGDRFLGCQTDTLFRLQEDWDERLATN